jgi:hypothetical protein
VAGTSVGALNAALFTQDGLHIAQNIWRDISFGKVLKTHPIGFVFAILFRILLAPVFLVRVVPSFWEAVEAFESYKKAGFSSPLAASESVSRMAIPFIKTAAAFIGLTAFLEGVLARRIPFVGDASFWLVILLLLGPFIVLWWWLFKVHNTLADRLALFSNEPLQTLVNQALEPRKIRLAPFPTYVTLAWLRWVLVLPGEERPAGSVHSLVNYRLQFTPIYRDLRELSDYGIKEHVIQSAGLPEVFPRRVVSGVPVVDGGVADNTPIQPVLDADGFVVIYLHSHPDKRNLIETESVRVHEILDQLPPMSEKDAACAAALWLVGQEGVEGGDKATEDEAEQRVAKPILAIVPSQNLGNLLTGTMNFSARKARRLMWLGYWDTLGTLEEGTMKWLWNKTSTQDDAERAEVLRLSRAAADGDSASQFELGLRYDRGRGVAQDAAEAMRLFTMAADAGNPAAQMALATRYLQGIGVQRNPSEGLRLLLKAAEGGDANAQSSLGMIYVTGRLVPLDYSEGVKWLRKAAAHGNPAGLTGLGQCYEIGAGVATDFVEAYRLYTLAITKYGSGSDKVKNAGKSDAQSRLDALKSRMTPQQISLAEKRLIANP